MVKNIFLYKINNCENSKFTNKKIKNIKKRLIIKEKIKVKLIILKISYIITNKKYELIKNISKKFI